MNAVTATARGKDGENQGLSGPQDGICGNWALPVSAQLSSSPRPHDSPVPFLSAKEGLVFLETEPPLGKL